MVVEDVLVKPLDFVRVEVIQADVKEQRDDGQLVMHQQGFGLLKKFLAFLQIRLFIGLVDQRVVTRIFPAGAVVAVVAE